MLATTPNDRRGSVVSWLFGTPATIHGQHAPLLLPDLTLAYA